MRPSGGGKTAPHLPCAVARPDRLPGRVPHRHPRLRRAEPPVPRLRALQGRRSRAAATACWSPTPTATAVAYALWNLEERGPMFVGAGETVYQGMIIGENARGNDLDVNPMKAKQLTNIRTTGKDEAIRLTPPRRLTPGAGDRLYRRRRAGRGHAQIDPPAQAPPRPQRPQPRRARRRRVAICRGTPGAHALKKTQGITAEAPPGA